MERTMNKTCQQLFKDAQNFKQFSISYFKYLYELLNVLDLNQVEAFVREIEDAEKHQNTLFIVGNGGSAATASHMANDFGPNIFSKSDQETHLRALALTDNSPVMLAIGNDSGYNELFLNQLKIHYRPGDKLIAISASGNSPNIIEAVNFVKSKGGKIIGLVGFDGGKLHQLSDVSILVKTVKGEYAPVEDIHMVMNHLIVTWLQYKNQKI